MRHLHDAPPPPLAPLAQHLAYSGFLKKAADIASFYGFQLIEPPEITKADAVRNGDYEFPSNRVAMIKHFLQAFDARHPSLFAYTTKVPYKQRRQLHLEIIGTPRSSAETLLFQTGYTIAREYGITAPEVHINSVGEKDTINNFTRELTAYYRKHISEIDDHCKETFKNDVWGLLQCTNKKCQPLKEQAPRPMNFLSEASRRHFREILESLDALQIPYTINHTLLGDRNYTTRTIFEMRDSTVTDEPRTIAFGERYDGLARRAGLGSHIPAIALSLEIECKNMDEEYRPVGERRATTPQVFLVQIGMEAKRLGLLINESLRQARIGTSAVFTEDGMESQLAVAHALGVPFLLIIGQKEALEQTVMIRETETHAQHTIPMTDIVHFLKHRGR